MINVSKTCMLYIYIHTNTYMRVYVCLGMLLIKNNNNNNKIVIIDLDNG